MGENGSVKQMLDNRMSVTKRGEKFEGHIGGYGYDAASHTLAKKIPGLSL